MAEYDSIEEVTALATIHPEFAQVRYASFEDTPTKALTSNRTRNARLCWEMMHQSSPVHPASKK
jgi:hypothetical protein